MRDALREVARQIPEHIGLAYHAWADLSPGDGKVADAHRLDWLKGLSESNVAADYETAFQRWRKSFDENNDRTFTLTLQSRLLIGHGNTSAVDVGLTVHHTWGVPMVPGSALKGLLAHYVEATYGPNDADLPPWEQPGSERERVSFQGTRWRQSRIERGPGQVYRCLFGAPEAEQDEVMRQHQLPAGAARGLVCFHDALYVPNSGASNKPYAADVLTVHQKEYYDSEGERSPNDYEAPNPVSFLTIRPGVQLLFALSGPTDWTALAERLLREALNEWGLGGKTSAGYGRIDDQSNNVATARNIRQPAARNRPKPGERVTVRLLEERTKKGGWRAVHEESNLSGPVQGSDQLPQDSAPGNQLELIVASVNDREMAFRVPRSTRVDKQ